MREQSFQIEKLYMVMERVSKNKGKSCLKVWKEREKGRKRTCEDKEIVLFYWGKGTILGGICHVDTRQYHIEARRRTKMLTKT